MKTRAKSTIYYLFIFLIITCASCDVEAQGISKLFDDYFIQAIARNPDWAIESGLTPEMGFDYPKGQFTDISEKAYLEEMEMIREYREKLDEYGKDELSEKEMADAEIFRYYLDEIIERDNFRYFGYTFNYMLGFHNAMTTAMSDLVKVRDKKEADIYLSYLENYSVKSKYLIENLEMEKEAGIIPPKSPLERMLNAMTDFIAVPVEENVLYTSFDERLAEVDGMDDDSRQDYLAKAKNGIENYVYPMYEKLITHCNDLLENPGKDTGVWQHPNGDEYYKFCLKRHTTTDLSPQQIHELGLREVARIQAELKEIYLSMGFEEKATFGEMENDYWNTMRAMPELNYENSDDGRKKVIDDYQGIIDDTYEYLPELFSYLPETKVEVKRVPKYKENTMGTYYLPAPFDGSRKGIFYVNLSWIPSAPGMKTLTFHEAVPGHHLQFAIQNELPDYRLFRHFTFFTGYIEGWALYAEKLGLEQGWYDNVYSKAGHLMSELFRAARLVVDTGLHYKKWTREEAYNYMVENLGWGSYGEIDRYLVWPGQACAYKVGQLKILELRELAMEELGDDFDIKEFHSVVLENGQIPLTILEKQVNEYIESKKN